MKAKTVRFETVEDYVRTFAPDIQRRLEQISAAILQAVPDAEPRISYHMPAYWKNGFLVYFSAFRKHIGFYPASESIFTLFRDELAGFPQSGRGTVRFPYAQPLPLDLIQKIAAVRAQENEREG